MKRLFPDWLYDHEHQMVRTGPRAIAVAGLAATSRLNVLVRSKWPGWKRRYGELRLHLGCGDKYVPGWINADLNPLRRIDLWIDIAGPLPFEANEVQVIASFHVLEHLEPAETRQTLRECWRVLKPCGLLRVGVPSLEVALGAYQHDDWGPYESMQPKSSSRGGRFNEAVLYHGQHKQAFDYGYLAELLTAAGFRDVRRVDGWESALLSSEELVLMQNANVVPYSLFVEAHK